MMPLTTYIRYLALLFNFALILCGCKYERAIYSLPGNYKLKVIKDSEWEYQQPMYYEIRKGDKIVVPKTYFGVTGNGESLSVVINGNVIGFTQSGNPMKLVILLILKRGVMALYEKR